MSPLHLKSTYQVSTSKLGAIVIGSLGIILVSGSGIGLAAKSHKHCQLNNTAAAPLVNISENATTLPSTEVQGKFCTPFSAAELAGSLLALLGGSVMWSVSSGKFFTGCSYSLFSWHKI